MQQKSDAVQTDEALVDAAAGWDDALVAARAAIDAGMKEDAE